MSSDYLYGRLGTLGRGDRHARNLCCGQLDVRIPAHWRALMTRFAAATAVTMLAASGALAQAFDFDPRLDSENLTTMEPSSPDPSVAGPAPAFLAPACELRREQFEDASGFRVRDVRVCCVQGQCPPQFLPSPSIMSRLPPPVTHS